MTTTPRFTLRSSWFQFRLRTLFAAVTLVAIVVGWLVWQQKIVERRHEFLDQFAGNGGSYAVLGNPVGSTRNIYIWLRQSRGEQWFQTEYPTKVPDRTLAQQPGPYRCWLGDRTIAIIEVPQSLPDVAEAARALFPEATISDSAPNGRPAVK